ncbi:uncharacterized protein si:ch211-152f22.4 isoform X3 [Dicentrarchus labrax]|uniref:uncharacterized protein si:ch211-152f22.4 isoform X2 n=1 Tax=Dicentrarchus labrax TaxID=13489 RepID=UPI0021F62877|nr:uncharacterized protein si:ch211-152f22.4 isoform X2 [Dicentrarchus labrax]XP_051231585.1 uncharacterized protein si:ch211-152f22.4 isoform X3 [Dicentrarchus labrax]
MRQTARGSLRGRGSERWRATRTNSLQPTRRDHIRQGTDGYSGILTTKRRLLKMVVSTLQPLEITEDPNFRDFVKALHPSFSIPSKSTMQSQLLSVYNEMESDLRSKLASADDIVLTCELWSSGAEDSHLTVGCHFVDCNGNLMSYTLKTTSLFRDESAAHIQTQLSAIMDAWQVKEKVHWVVRAGMPQLKNVKAQWGHMPCFADSLNVVFKGLMSDNELSNVVRKSQDIVRFFKKDSEAERKLREIQNGLKFKQDKLILYSGDRWLPSLHMLQRLMEQYPAMMMVFDERGKTDLILNESDKEKIKKIISALEPLREVMSRMKEKGFQSISAVLPLLKILMDSLREEAKCNDVAKTLLLKCKKEFGDVNNNPFLAPIMFLDPRFKNQLGDENKRQAMDKIKTELSAFCSAAELNELVNEYVAYKPNSEESNPLAWWRHTGKEKFGKLSKLGLQKLGVVSTAVPLERAFSSAGDQFCSLRSSIEPENLNMILFLNSNWSSKT